MRQSLAGFRIAVPESRQHDVLARLMTRRGAEVWRCPMVGIVDAPDPAPVIECLRTLIAQPPDIVVLLTGEGLRRLRGFAEQAGISDEALRAALTHPFVLSRGPKPAKALRDIGLAPDAFADAPTTEGVIQTLAPMPLAGRRVVVQLYGDDPNARLIGFLASRGARVNSVAPYRYARQSSRDEIRRLIRRLADARLDAVVFTSRSQVQRLFSEAAALDATSELIAGLHRCCVAAIGPVVADALRAQTCMPDVMPDQKFFMKPMVHALAQKLARTG